MRRALVAACLFVLLAAPGHVHGGPAPLVIRLTHADYSNGMVPAYVEQQSPAWRTGYSGDNSYNAWKCTHDGTYEEYQAGGGTAHPDTCVQNPFRIAPGCTWDIDDTEVWHGFGALAADTVASATTCNVNDYELYNGWGGEPRRVEVSVSAPTDGLTVAATSSYGEVHVLTPAVNGSGFAWVMCGVTDRQPGPYPVIPDSNGGVGIRSYWTLTVSAGKRSVRDVFATLQTGMWPYQFNICPPYP